MKTKTNILVIVLGPQVFVGAVVFASYLVLTRAFELSASNALVLALPTLLISMASASFGSRSLLNRDAVVPRTLSRSLILKGLAISGVSLVVIMLAVLMGYVGHSSGDLRWSVVLSLIMALSGLILVLLGRAFIVEISKIERNRS